MVCVSNTYRGGQIKCSSDYFQEYVLKKVGVSGCVVEVYSGPSGIQTRNSAGQKTEHKKYPEKKVLASLQPFRFFWGRENENNVCHLILLWNIF